MEDRMTMDPSDYARAFSTTVSPPPHPSVQSFLREFIQRRYMATGNQYLLKFHDARTQHGLDKYGTELYAFNSRDALRDAIQEAYDLSLYLLQRVIEEPTSKGRLNHFNTAFDLLVELFNEAYL